MTNLEKRLALADLLWLTVRKETDEEMKPVGVLLLRILKESIAQVEELRMDVRDCETEEGREKLGFSEMSTQQIASTEQYINTCIQMMDDLAAGRYDRIIEFFESTLETKKQMLKFLARALPGFKPKPEFRAIVDRDLKELATCLAIVRTRITN